MQHQPQAPTLPGGSARHRFGAPVEIPTHLVLPEPDHGPTAMLQGGVECDDREARMNQHPWASNVAAEVIEPWGLLGPRAQCYGLGHGAAGSGLEEVDFSHCVASQGPELTGKRNRWCFLGTLEEECSRGCYDLWMDRPRP